MRSNVNGNLFDRLMRIIGKLKPSQGEKNRSTDERKDKNALRIDQEKDEDEK